MEILITVKDQKLRMPRYLTPITEGTQNFIKFKFELPEDWADLTIFAQFIQNGTGYNQFLDSDNSVFLPPEITAGVCDLVLYGTGGENGTVIATSNYLSLTIDDNALIKDAQNVEITESLFSQLVYMLKSSVATIPEVMLYLDI